MGELLPFWAWRLDHRMKEEGWNEKNVCKKTISEYLNENIYITTSGYFNTPGLMHALSVMGPDRVMFSVDYPYEDNMKASKWIESVDLPEKDKKKICYLNASKLLGLNIK